MPPMGTPSSVIQLLARRVWHRARVGIRRMYSEGASSENSATRLPLELVEMIIEYLIYDMRCLRACTMTCHSWYIVASPHLHRSLTISITPRVRKSGWQETLQHMHTLGLLPSVKRLWVAGCKMDTVGFCPGLFNSSTLNRFSALTNVRELEVEFLDIPKFIPHIQRYFKHFLPTLTSLSLTAPRGSDRQIVYFIGLFQHLQDLKLINIGLYSWGRPADDPTLIPPFVPPLRGRLSVSRFMKVDLLKDMIDLFGGIRFYRMRFFEANGMRLLLDAGAETLEFLVLDPADPRVGSSLRDLDLSRNKSLRRLAFPASSIDGSPGTTSFLKHVVSTVAPSSPLKIYLAHGENRFPGVGSWRSDSPRLSKAKREKAVSRYHQLFEVLREVYGVRSFHLVLSVGVWGRVGEEPVRMLEEVIAEETARGGFDGFPCKPSVVYLPQEFRLGQPHGSVPF